jgi:hypothetical protein
MPSLIYLIGWSPGLEPGELGLMFPFEFPKIFNFSKIVFQLDLLVSAARHRQTVVITS